MCIPATGACFYPAKSDGTTCDDNNACTQTDTCQSGVCVGSNPVTCSASMCQVAGTCNPSTGVCSSPTNAQDGSTCSDSNACTVGDMCQSGVCKPGANTGCPGVLSISPSSLTTFQSTVVSGSSPALTFTVSNTGTGAAGTTTGISVTTSGTNAGDFMIVSSNCPLSLAAE